MALRDLLVHADHSAAGVTRMRLAADLAARHGARLAVLHVREPSIEQQRQVKLAELGLMPAAKVTALQKSIEQKLDAGVTLLRGHLDRLALDLGLDTEWRSIEGRAGKLVVQQSRTADLTVIGHTMSQADDLPDEYSFAETMLFGSGRPLLIVPDGMSQATLGHRIALAWNASRPAARALSDALPLIERAERTFVLTVDPAGIAHPGTPESSDILAHLGCHTGSVELRSLKAGGHALGDLLQSEALAQGADLLVAGAYGQPKLWEKMLGGTTRDLLSRMRLPILMSH